MPDPIGIVACSGPGAALCYETICCESPELLGPHQHPELSMHGYSFGTYVPLLEAGDWRGVGKLMADSAKHVASLGAKFAICPDNTVHEALDYVLADSPIPWLHIAEVVAREAQRRELRRLAVLGTRYLMEGPVYRDKLDALDIEWRIPGQADRETIQRIIFDELVFSRIQPESQRDLGRIIAELAREQGCDAVVLGCTELPLAVTSDVSPLPTLDSTRLLARAAIRRSVAGEST